MRRILLLTSFAAALSVATPALAQQAGTVSPGMTMAEVRATLGPPAVVREADGRTYFFYVNRCLPRCGTDDTVFFSDGRVVTAHFHSPARRFAGPPAAATLRGDATAPPRPAAPPATVTGVRIGLSPAPDASGARDEADGSDDPSRVPKR